MAQKERKISEKKKKIDTTAPHRTLSVRCSKPNLASKPFFSCTSPSGFYAARYHQFFCFFIFFLTCTTGFAEKEGMLVIYELQRTYRTNSVQEWKIPQFREYISVPWLSKLSPNSLLKWRIPCLFSRFKGSGKTLNNPEISLQDSFTCFLSKGLR